MLYLVILPIHAEGLLTMTQTLDTLALDAITGPYIVQIAELKIGEYYTIRGRYVIVRIQ